MHYYGISRTDIDEAISESRKAVQEIKIDYSIYSEFPRLLSESRMAIDKIMKETRYL